MPISMPARSALRSRISCAAFRVNVTNAMLVAPATPVRTVVACLRGHRVRLAGAGARDDERAVLLHDDRLSLLLVQFVQRWVVSQARFEQALERERNLGVVGRLAGNEVERSSVGEVAHAVGVLEADRFGRPQARILTLWRGERDEAALPAPWPLDGDADRMVALFSDAATYRETPFDDAMQGRSAIREYWRSAAHAQQDVEFASEVWALTSDSAIAGWQARFTRRASGERVELDGAFWLVFAGEHGPLQRKELEEWWHSRRSRGSTRCLSRVRTVGSGRTGDVGAR